MASSERIRKDEESKRINQILTRCGLCAPKLRNAGIPISNDTKGNTKNFRKWSVKNHPDKGGNLLRYQEISVCFDTLQIFADYGYFGKKSPPKKSPPKKSPPKKSPSKKKKGVSKCPSSITRGNVVLKLKKETTKSCDYYKMTKSEAKSYTKKTKNTSKKGDMFDKMTVKQLKEYLKSKGVRGYSKFRRAELLKIIREGKKI